MTIVGDLAQSTGAWAHDPWDEIVTALAMDCPTELKELTLGYRVPQQIFTFATQLLPFAAPELTAPRVVRIGPADPELIRVDPSDIALQAVKAASRHAGSGRFVGVICPDQLPGEVESQLLRSDVSWGDVGAGDLDKSINLALGT